MKALPRRNVFARWTCFAAPSWRRVIAEMGQHDAPFSPTTFAVWYEHFAGINRGLSQAMAVCLTSNGRINVKRLREALDRSRTEAITDPLTHLLSRVAKEPGVSAARVGGEEFALLLAQGTAAPAVQLAQALRGLLSAAEGRTSPAQRTPPA